MTSPFPVNYGFVGCARIGHTQTGAQPDLAPVAHHFLAARSARVTHWSGSGITAVSSDCAEERGGSPGAAGSRVASYQHLEGVIYGSFFGDDKIQYQQCTLATRLLKEFAAGGEGAFRDLNGSWVAVIQDNSRQIVHFARDPSGAEKLYVKEDDLGIWFATDLRLLHYFSPSRGLSRSSVAQYLHYFYVPAPRTLYQDSVAVLPGHEVHSDSLDRQRKFELPRFVMNAPLKQGQSVEDEIERQLPAFEEHLLSAVSDCLPNSGDVAVTLSGGKDSSVLAVALSKLCPERVIALTVGQSDPSQDESSDAARVCQSLGLRHHVYYLPDEDIAEGVRGLVRSLDQPMADPAAIPYYLGMASLPADCRVIIDGSGADYAFGTQSREMGIWRYLLPKKLQDALPRIVWKALLNALRHGPAGTRNLHSFWSQPYQEGFVIWNGWSQAELTAMLRESVSFSDTYLWRVMENEGGLHWIELLTYVLCTVFEAAAGVRKAADSAHSLGKGVRFPFLDRRYGSFIGALPQNLKYTESTNKLLLRAYMKRNLPPAIVGKPKHGFNVDLGRFLVDPATEWASRAVASTTLSTIPLNHQGMTGDYLDRLKRDPADVVAQQRLYAICLLMSYLES